jgi:sec-independent protein translocase protein TatB
MFNIGGSEMIVLAVLALLVFGPEGLPGIIKNVMRTVNAVKIAARDFQTEVKTALEVENERQDLAKRQRTPIQEPPHDSAALAAAAIPPMPDEEESTTSEQDGEESAVTSQVDEAVTVGQEPEVAASESAPEEESAPEALVEEDPDDDDGPRIPMGRAPRSKSAEKEVTETT